MRRTVTLSTLPLALALVACPADEDAIGGSPFGRPPAGGGSSGGASDGGASDAADAGASDAADAGAGGATRAPDAADASQPDSLPLVSTAEGSATAGPARPELFSWTQARSAPDDFGLAAHGNELTLWVRIGGARLLRFDLAERELPGVFPVGEGSDEIACTLTEVTAGQVVVYDGYEGRLELASCPSEIGDALMGRLDGIDLMQRGGSNRKRLRVDGSFSTWLVRSTRATIACAGEGEGEPECEPSPPCLAASPGPCCADRRCIEDCAAGCYLQSCRIPDEATCRQCVEGCLDGCAVAAACRETWTALNECELAASCFDDPDPGRVLACAADPCCAEVAAALGGS